MNQTPYFGNTFNNPYYPSSYPLIQTPQPNYPQPTNRYILPGRAVNSEEEITYQEVPMDGSIAVFPKIDGSAIFVRSVNNKGAVETKTYVLSESTSEQASNDTPQISLLDIMNQLDNINDVLDVIKNSNTYSNRKSQNKQYKYNKDTNTKEKDDVNA